MRISEKLGIHKTCYELDFYDYELGKDTYKFIDPYYISKQEDAFLRECDEYVKTFFNRFLSLLQYNETEALDLFKHLGEINEICLGMSTSEPAGRGIGKLNSKTIFDSIKKSAAFSGGLIENIEDVRLFIEGVDKDKISDMVANIIRLPLIEYTKQQCKLYGIQLRTSETGYYWNKDTSSWDRGHDEMLIVDDKKYLLFPKNLVSDFKYYSAEEYFRHYILNFLQDENIKHNTSLVRKTYDKNGAVKKRVYKKDIIEDIQSRGECLTKDWFANFSMHNPDVLRNFKRSIIDKMSKNQPDQVDSNEFNQVIDTLISELNNISAGSDNASAYHKLMFSILQMLFYPYIMHPRIENEINDGRKRIDIVFNNVAEEGFFHLLPANYNIPCQLIMVECKNYSKDINNPELDQMAGRFSPNRGRFGIICCRSLDNQSEFVKRERDTVKDGRGWIITLTDDDVIQLLNDKKTGKSVDEFMLTKFDEIIR